MTPAVALLDRLRARGVTLEANGDRLRVRPASALTPDELEALRRHKPQVLILSAYRAALLDFWRLNAAGPDIAPAVAAAASSEVLRLMDEVGEPMATTLRRRWEAEWYEGSGRCPRCGEQGERHE